MPSNQVAHHSICPNMFVIALSAATEPTPGVKRDWSPDGTGAHISVVPGRHTPRSLQTVSTLVTTPTRCIPLPVCTAIAIAKPSTPWAPLNEPKSKLSFNARGREMSTDEEWPDDEAELFEQSDSASQVHWVWITIGTTIGGWLLSKLLF
jgi:hypothetical protein